MKSAPWLLVLSALGTEIPPPVRWTPSDGRRQRGGGDRLPWTEDEDSVDRGRAWADNVRAERPDSGNIRPSNGLVVRPADDKVETAQEGIFNAVVAPIDSTLSTPDTLGEITNEIKPEATNASDLAVANELSAAELSENYVLPDGTSISTPGDTTEIVAAEQAGPACNEDGFPVCPGEKFDCWGDEGVDCEYSWCNCAAGRSFCKTGVNPCASGVIGHAGPTCNDKGFLVCPGEESYCWGDEDNCDSSSCDCVAGRKFCKTGVNPCAHGAVEHAGPTCNDKGFPVCPGGESYCSGDKDNCDSSQCDCAAGRSFCETGINPCNCRDTPNWIDSNGHGCDWYEEKEVPGCRLNGDGFDGGMGTAKGNCCYCKFVVPSWAPPKQPSTRRPTPSTPGPTRRPTPSPTATTRTPTTTPTRTLPPRPTTRRPTPKPTATTKRPSLAPMETLPPGPTTRRPKSMLTRRPTTTTTETLPPRPTPPSTSAAIDQSGFTCNNRGFPVCPGEEWDCYGDEADCDGTWCGCPAAQRFCETGINPCGPRESTCDVRGSVGFPVCQGEKNSCDGGERACSNRSRCLCPSGQSICETGVNPCGPDICRKNCDCRDTPNWFDEDGDGCDWYEDTEKPGCRVNGDGFDGGMGTANDNCCWCKFVAPSTPRPTTRWPTPRLPIEEPSNETPQPPRPTLIIRGPTGSPTRRPSRRPLLPSRRPTPELTIQPTQNPTLLPSRRLTPEPSSHPIRNPTEKPTNEEPPSSPMRTTYPPSPQTFVSAATGEVGPALAHVGVEDDDYVVGDAIVVAFNYTGGKEAAIAVYPHDATLERLDHSIREDWAWLCGNQTCTNWRNFTSDAVRFSNVSRGSWIACLVEVLSGRGPRRLQSIEDVKFSTRALSSTPIFTVRGATVITKQAEVADRLPWRPFLLAPAVLIGCCCFYGLHKYVLAQHFPPQSTTAAPETTKPTDSAKAPQIKQEDDEEAQEEDGFEDDEFSMPSMSSCGSRKRSGTKSSNKSCEVLLLDHIFMNYEKGRQDILKAFYFDFLACAIDPRKEDNYDLEQKTFFANIGLHQFRLEEGLDAPAFDGAITLVYKDLNPLTKRYKEYLKGAKRFAPLKETEFCVQLLQDKILVTEPWGREFVILPSSDPEEDRASHLGAQPSMKGHTLSEGLKLQNITVYVKRGANLEGIGRFYEYLLGASVARDLTTESSISIAMGTQTLTFLYRPAAGDEQGKPLRENERVVTMAYAGQHKTSDHAANFSLGKRGQRARPDQSVELSFEAALGGHTSMEPAPADTTQAGNLLTLEQILAGTVVFHLKDGKEVEITSVKNEKKGVDPRLEPKMAHFGGEIHSDNMLENWDTDDKNYNSDSSYGGYDGCEDEDGNESFDRAVEGAVTGMLESGAKGVLEALVDGKSILEGGLEGALGGAVEGAIDVAVAGTKRAMKKKMNVKKIGVDGKVGAALEGGVAGGLEGIFDAVLDDAMNKAVENAATGAVEGAVEGGAKEALKDRTWNSDAEAKGNSKAATHAPNYGPHIALFVTDLSHAYQMASDLGVQYVNTRFGRRAYTEEQVVDQSMFRFMDIVDPYDISDEPEVIARLEHKVRSTRTKDGKKYKSFPLF